MLDLSYPFRLLRNAYTYYRRTGLKPALIKSKQVVKRWFGEDLVIAPISREEYHDWIEKYEKPPVKGVKLVNKPKISILMPVYNVDEDYLLAAFDSIKGQSYENWELCMVDDASPKPHIKPLLQKLKELDKRVKISFSEVNNHISVTTNKAFELSDGEFLLLMDNDDLLAEGALEALMECINEHPEADLVYFDEDKIDDSGERFDPFFKPNPSPEMLLETMYPVHALYSRSIFEKAGMLRKGYEGSQDYDLALRVFELTEEIYHLPHILYHWRITDVSTAASTANKPYVIDAAKKSISEAIERRGYTGDVTGANYPFKCSIDIIGTPSVEIIIPTKDKLKYVKRAIDSIVNKSTYKNYTITVVDNNSIEPATLKYFDKIVKSGHKVLKYSEAFNFSAINNFAAKESSAEYLLFLNNDTEVLTPKWIEEMLIWAQMDRVGAVGAKLLFPNHHVQHAGIVMGMGPRNDDNYPPVANHLYYGELDGTARQFNQLNMVQNLSAVTAACLLIRRAKFNLVGGFNEKELAVAFNDVDICLKLHDSGLRNVYTPHARLIHYESISRSRIPAETETEYMYRKWKKYIDSDPYYNSNFDKNTIVSYVLPK